MSFLLPRKPETIPLPFVIVCEGHGDACFIDRLLEFNQINNCNIGCPSREGCEDQQGDTDLQRYLAGVSLVMSKTNPKLQGLLVVVDANDHPNTQFDAAVGALAFAEFPAPSRPFSIETVNGFRVAVFLMPGNGKTGTLENVLLEAALSRTPAFEPCLEAFATCTGVIASSSPGLKSL